MNRIIPAIAVAGLAVLSLTACSSGGAAPLPTALPEGTVSAGPSASPSALPSGLPADAGLVKQPAATSVDGESVARTVHKGALVQIPTDAEHVEVNLTDPSGVLADVNKAPKAALVEGDLAKKGILFYAASTGTASGTIAFLGDDLKPTGKGIAFTVEVK